MSDSSQTGTTTEAQDTASWITTGINDNESVQNVQEQFLQRLIEKKKNKEERQSSENDDSANNEEQIKNKRPKKVKESRKERRHSQLEEEEREDREGDSEDENREGEEEEEREDREGDDVEESASQSSFEDENSQDGVETEIPERFDELAEAIGTTEDDLMRLKVKTVVNGQVGEATLSDLVKNYQLESNVNEKSKALSEEKARLNEQYNAYNQELADKYKQVEGIINALESEYRQEFENIDWKSLKEEDETQYLIQMHEKERRERALENAKQSFHKQLINDNEANKKQQQERLSQLRQNEYNMLMEKLPNWRDSNNYEKESKALTSYLINQGYRDDEISNLYDHRSVILARKAMLYDNMEKKANVAKKKIKILPKVITPSARKTNREIERSDYDKKMRSLRKTGSAEIASDLFLDRLSRKKRK